MYCITMYSVFCETYSTKIDHMLKKIIKTTLYTQQRKYFLENVIL